ncbi:MAG: sulfotransferase [Pseudomonadota bacterium]
MPTGPNNVEALLAKGVNALRSGKPQRALKPLRSALRAAPESAHVMHLLASALGQTGQFGEAEKWVRRALDTDPAPAEFHETLGHILNNAGQIDSAVDAYRRALVRTPRLPGALFNLARLLTTRGERNDAITHYTQLLQGEGLPASLTLQARRELGRLLMAAGEFATAERVLAKALAAQPEHVATRVRLGRARQMLGDAEGALSVLSGDEAAVVAERARVLQSLGRLVEAADGFEAALGMREDAADLAGLVEVRLWQGDVQAAAGQLMRMADANAPSLAMARARVGLAQGLEALGAASHITELESWIDADEAGTSDRALQRQLLFCLADVHHAVDQAAAAFPRYKQANAVRRGHFDPIAHRAFVDDLIRVYSEDHLASMSRSDGVGPGPVFIVGMPRSGTSLVEQVLGRHPDVVPLGERSDVARSFLEFAHRDTAWAEHLAAVTQSTLDGVARDYWRAAAVGGEPRWATDKMPQNAFYVGWIAQLFPNARVVHCQRTPEAVALSCFRQDFHDPSLAFADDLEHLASMYHDTERVCAHWASVRALPMVSLDYEALVDDFEAEVRRLLDALSLPFDARCLSFERAARFVNTASHAQVRKGLYQGARDGWRRYADALSPFTLALARLRSGTT